MDTDPKGIDDQTAALALDGFSLNQTVTVAAILARDARLPKKVSDLTGLHIAIGVMKEQAVQSMLHLALDTGPHDVERIAMLQARVKVYHQLLGVIEKYAERREQIAKAMRAQDDEAELAAVLREYGLDEPNDETMGYDT